MNAGQKPQHIKIYKMKIYLTLIFILTATTCFCQKVVEMDSLKKIENKYYYKNELFSGVIESKYTNGKLKIKWEVKKGLPDGKVIGYYVSFSSSPYTKKYEYNYSSGIKIGDQLEYYQKNETLPYYSIPLQTITDFDAMFFGNRDGNSKINFYQKDGCSIKRDTINNKSIFPSDEVCPTGQLHVYYEGHSGPGKLFTKCYGATKCFWVSFKRNGSWWFD